MDVSERASHRPMQTLPNSHTQVHVELGIMGSHAVLYHGDIFNGRSAFGPAMGSRRYSRCAICGGPDAVFFYFLCGNQMCAVCFIYILRTVEERGRERVEERERERFMTWSTIMIHNSSSSRFWIEDKEIRDHNMPSTISTNDGSVNIYPVPTRGKNNKAPIKCVMLRRATGVSVIM